MRFVSYYSRAISDSSGVTAALWAWAVALADAGHEALVVHGGGPRRSPDPSIDRSRVPDIAVPHRGRSRRTYLPLGLGRLLRPGDVLILHEGWVLSNVAAAIAARRARVPYVVVPHGVYERGILRSLKPPRALRTAAERLVLEHARGVHVFWESECDLIRDVAPAARCVVAPTGFAPAADAWVGGGGYVAWMGRYDPDHKGLDLLLEGLARIPAGERPRLELRGPDYNGGFEATRRIVERLDLAAWVGLGGPVRDVEKVDFLRRADAYVHPSRWESHSIALLENLALGVPTLVSSAIHIAAALRDSSAAIIADPSPDGLAEGLGRVLAADPDLPLRARAFIADRLGWPAAVESFVRQVEARA